MMGMVVCGGSTGAVKLLPEDLEAIPCCYGSAEYGPEGCTCWAPIYNLDQQPPISGPIEVQPQLCVDCAFRKGSRERSSGQIEGITSFWCHQGMRVPVQYRHEDGRVREAEPDGYNPPIIEGIPYRANGQPALRCAGMARILAAQRP